LAHAIPTCSPRTLRTASSTRSLSLMPTKSIPIIDNDEANQLLIESPLALLVGMLLDHKVR